MAVLLAKIKDRPCLDCGGRFQVAVMDFDHRPGETKTMTLSYIFGLPPNYRRLVQELKKCDVVCANCHRIRTAQRRVAA
jgi:hypothetical protein